MRHPLSKIAFCFVVAAASAALANAPKDIRNVNGDAVVKERDVVGHVSTVNGDVRIGANARALSAKSANGEIRIASGASVGPVETTNGAITVSPKASTGPLTCTNCEIRIGAGAEVAGKVANVNGSIRAEGASITGTLETVTGEIVLLDGTRLDGTIRVAPPNNGGGGVAGVGNLPGVGRWVDMGGISTATIVIGPNVVVTQPIAPDREAELYVHRTAQVPSIHGANTIRYSDDSELPEGIFDDE
ncbi:MAG: hypothetical protein ACK4JC_03390 [Silanimonas lenta]